MSFLYIQNFMLKIKWFLLRWVVESINGRIKNWRAFDHVFPNTQVPFIGNYVRIICAIINAFKANVVQEKSDDDNIVSKMKARFSKINRLQKFIEDNRLQNARACWESVTDESLPDFPVLKLKDLKDLTLGVYQVSFFIFALYLNQRYVFSPPRTIKVFET